MIRDCIVSGSGSKLAKIAIKGCDLRIRGGNCGCRRTENLLQWRIFCLCEKIRQSCKIVVERAIVPTSVAGKVRTRVLVAISEEACVSVITHSHAISSPHPNQKRLQNNTSRYLNQEEWVRDDARVNTTSKPPEK